MPEKEVALTDAALQLRVSYNVALRLVLTGKLGGRRNGRRWVVSQQSLKRLLVAPLPETTPAA